MNKSCFLTTLTIVLMSGHFGSVAFAAEEKNTRVFKGETLDGRKYEKTHSITPSGKDRTTITVEPKKSEKGEPVKSDSKNNSKKESARESRSKGR